MTQKLYDIGRVRIAPVVLLEEDEEAPEKGDLPEFWYIFKTDPNCEERVIKGFDALGVHHWRAINYEERQVRATRKWAKPKMEKVPVPMFPRYLFANVAPDREWPDVAGIRGLLGALKMASGRFATVSASQIENLQVAIDQGYFDKVAGMRTIFEPGTDVRIVDGPFMGFPGKVVEAESGYDALIEIDMLGRIVPVQIEVNVLEAVENVRADSCARRANHSISSTGRSV